MSWIRSLIALIVLACPPASAQLRMLFAENEETTHVVDSATYIRSTVERHGTVEPPRPPSRTAAEPWTRARRHQTPPMLRGRPCRRPRRHRRRLLFAPGSDSDDDA